VVLASLSKNDDKVSNVSDLVLNNKTLCGSHPRKVKEVLGFKGYYFAVRADFLILF
jgi:hypothetical protein